MEFRGFALYQANAADAKTTRLISSVSFIKIRIRRPNDWKRR